MIDSTNSRIERTIQRTVATADILVTASGKPDVIIENLIKITDGFATTMIKQAAKSGVTVESVYNLIEIGGQSVWVDPCRVIND